MKKIIAAIVLSVILFTSCKKEEPKVSNLSLGDFTLSTDQFRAGDPVDIKYNGTDKDVEAVYYFMVNNKIYPEDINFSNENKAAFTIPDSAQAIAFNFRINGRLENNDKKGYLFPLTDKNGKAVTGSKAALAYYTLSNGERNGIAIDKAELLKEIEEDLTSNPELKKTWNEAYLSSLYRVDKKKGKELIRTYLKELSGKDPLTQKDYASMAQLYSMIRDQKRSDSIIKIVVSKYPNSNAAKYSHYKDFLKAKSLADKEAVFSEYKKAYPEGDNFGDYIARGLAMEFYKKGDLKKFNKYADMISKKETKASLYNSIAWPLAESGKDLDFAARISGSSLDLLKSQQTNLGDKPVYFSVNQYKKNLINTYNMYADTYALILFKQGKPEEALKYQEVAVGEGLNNDMNERYIEFLVANKKYKKAEEKAEEFIRKGAATQKTKDLYKTAFLKNNPDKKEFETKLAELEKIAHDKQLADIKKKMIDEKGIDFTLKDLDGKSVSLSSLKGKIVILDFWATWCGPCKASFPGMQKVVNKYKADDSVVILFVDTFERGKDRTQKVADFIKKNNYSFHVLFDNQLEDSNDFEVAPKYGITGIPTKIIIGPDGNIKFRAVGYSGNTEKLVNEMDMMIELLKQ